MIEIYLDLFHFLALFNSLISIYFQRSLEPLFYYPS